MSLEKFLNINVKKIKENKEKKELEELEPIPEAIKNEIKLKKAIEKRREEYKKRKSFVGETSDIEKDLMKQYKLETGKSAITLKQTIRKDYLKWLNEQ